MDAATTSLTEFFSFLSISKPSTPHRESVSLNFQSLTKAKLARLAAARTRSSVTSSSPESTSPILSVRNYNVLITVDNNDPEEKLVNQFRRQVLRAGILQECKRRRFFENSQAKRKRKARESAKRNRKRRVWKPESRAEEQLKQETTRRKDMNEEEDNWDFYQVDLPYCS
ncbi:30S ribosomal protein S21, chloroplastic-like [Cucurbita maxima]|uniref:30S ribosomal protein S21, chloroplastic-like n=1 Tax=Cucurbita maxima TaxID=3661 RepID=A0A6J1K257_CUCMA|nr:30S ribosomal protein S21, chloroplastic-like [Cucurbita maxima]